MVKCLIKDLAVETEAVEQRLEEFSAPAIWRLHKPQTSPYFIFYRFRDKKVEEQKYKIHKTVIQGNFFFKKSDRQMKFWEIKCLK